MWENVQTSNQGSQIMTTSIAEIRMQAHLVQGHQAHNSILGSSEGPNSISFKYRDIIQYNTIWNDIKDINVQSKNLRLVYCT